MILAFRNDISGNLAYINYNDGTLSVTEIEDTLEVYHPDISPDGKHVAFCTRFEGIAGESRLYVRDLNANGSNLRLRHRCRQQQRRSRICSDEYVASQIRKWQIWRP